MLYNDSILDDEKQEIADQIGEDLKTGTNIFFSIIEKINEWLNNILYIFSNLPWNK